MNKPVRIILIDNAFEKYPKLTLRIKDSIERKKDFLKQNPFYGNNIPKRLIPKKYNVKNLWRIELTDFWRMLYTIKGDDLEIFCFVVDILNHKGYNKILKY